MSHKLNSLGFSVLSDRLHSQVFPNKPRATLTPQAKRRVEAEYSGFSIDLPPAMPECVEHDWRLPKLQGQTLLEHFETIAKDFALDYEQRASKLAGLDQLPAMPKPQSVLIQPGWHRYLPGSSPEPVDAPVENCIVLDCETLVVRGGFPIIATAVSDTAWYIWLHPSLCDLSIDYVHKLYSIGSDKLVIGHNVTYDWQRCIESHWIDVPQGLKRSYFLDTLSMNVVTHGYSGPQSWAATMTTVPAHAASWANAGCGNSLLACYNFHAWPEVPLSDKDKSLRDIFVSQDLPVIRSHFLELIEYALLDVKYTWELFQALWPKYRQKRPSWTSLAGVLQQSAHNLPVVDNWFDWLQQCETKLAEYEEKISKAGTDIANKLHEHFQQLLTEHDISPVQHNTALKDKAVASAMPQPWQDLMADPWLGSAVLDWSIGMRVRKGKGQPAWYRGMDTLGKSSRLLHQLLKLEHRDETGTASPVLWQGRKLKWCKGSPPESITKPGTDTPAESLLVKDFTDMFKSGQLAATAEGSAEVLDLAIATTYWVSCRGRAKDQIVYYDELAKCNVITPDLRPTGTVSGRGVSPLWLTVTDCKPYNNHKIGVELKSRVQPPPGKVLVQADFSAQELRIAAMYADSIAARQRHDCTEQLGYVGASPMSHGVYAGNKELGTDPHTMLAKSVGIDRDTAKAVAYSLIYRAGKKTVARVIMWSYATEPGDRVALLRKATAKAEQAIAYKRGKLLDRGGQVFAGGTDSAAYTKLALMAAKSRPRTPLLGNELTAPLCPVHCGGDFVTARTNWGIQATARDQGDCLSVAFQWLCWKHGIDARHIFLYSCR